MKGVQYFVNAGTKAIKESETVKYVIKINAQAYGWRGVKRDARPCRQRRLNDPAGRADPARKHADDRA